VRDRYYRALCVKPESPRRCYCVAGSYELCPVPLVGARASEAKCPASRVYTGKESEPCSGYWSENGPNWENVSRVVKGEIECPYCDFARAQRETFVAVHGTPCQGYQSRDLVIAGEWVCEK